MKFRNIGTLNFVHRSISSAGAREAIGCAELSALVFRAVLVSEGCGGALTWRQIAIPYLTSGLPRSGSERRSGRCSPTVRLRDLPHLRFAKCQGLDACWIVRQYFWAQVASIVCFSCRPTMSELWLPPHLISRSLYAIVVWWCYWRRRIG